VGGEEEGMKREGGICIIGLRVMDATGFDLSKPFCPKIAEPPTIHPIKSNYHRLMFCGDKMAIKRIFDHIWCGSVLDL